MTLKTAPVVKSIQGGVFDGADTPQESTITIQYQGVDEHLYDVKMPFLDGMYLLNILKKIKEESGFEIPEGS